MTVRTNHDQVHRLVFRAGKNRLRRSSDDDFSGRWDALGHHTSNLLLEKTRSLSEIRLERRGRHDRASVQGARELEGVDYLDLPTRSLRYGSRGSHHVVGPLRKITRHQDRSKLSSAHRPPPVD